MAAETQTERAKRNGKPAGKAHLQIVHVDGETGQKLDRCPGCVEAEGTIGTLELDNSMLERDLAAKRRRISELERDREAEARAHQLWPRAVRLFDVWREATGHLKAEWNAERFWLALPALKAYDDYWIERAIAGIAFDPFTKRSRNGKTIRYDKWENLFKKVANVGVYAERAPADYTAPPRAEVTELARGIGRFISDRARLIEETDDAVDLARIYIEIDRRCREYVEL